MKQLRTYGLRLLIAALFLVPAVAGAQSLTVADGTFTSADLPVVPSSLDLTCHTQFVYPASMLDSLAGNTVLSLSFHAMATSLDTLVADGPVNRLYTPTFTVRMGPCDDTTYATAAFKPTSGMVVVYVDQLNVENGVMTAELTTPYIYTGGNLLVDIQWDGDDGTVGASMDYFLGIATSYYSGIAKETYYANNYVQQRHYFLPKMTVGYDVGTSTYCMPVSDLQVAYVNADSMQVSWISHGEGSWRVLLDGDEVAVVDTTVYFLEWLEAGSGHTVSVVAVCGDGVEAEAVTQTFNVPSNALPIAEDFEGTTNVNALEGWHVVKSFTAAAYGTYPRIVTDQSHGGSNSLAMRRGSSSQTSMICTDMPLPLPANQLYVHFYAYVTSGVSSVSTTYLKAGIITDTTDVSTFVRLEWYPITDSWVECAFSTDTIAGADTIQGPYFFAFYTNNVGAMAYIDDVTIDAIPVCVAPSGFSLADVSTTEATVHWNGGSPAYVAEIGLRDFQPGTGTSSSVTENSITLDNLQPGTTYDLYVASNCPDGNSDSVLFRFSTLAVPVADFPYGTTFDDNVSSGWSFVGATNPWIIGTAAGSGDNSALYVSSDGVSNAYSGSVYAVSYAMREISITDTGVYRIQYDWRCGGEGTRRDVMRAWLAPSPVSVTTGRFVDGTVYNTNTPPSYDAPEGWINISGGALYGDTAWHTRGEVFPISEAGTYTLVFCWCNNANGSGSQPPAAIDNLYFAPSYCPSPVEVTLADATFTSLSLQWMPAADETLWRLAIPDVVDTILSVTSFTVDNLVPGTDYAVSLRSVCSEYEASLPLTVTFSTLVPPLPVVEIEGAGAVDVGDTLHLAAVVLDGDADDLVLSWSSAMVAAGDAVSMPAADGVSIIYSAPGTDTVVLVAANAYGADTAVHFVMVSPVALPCVAPEVGETIATATTLYVTWNATDDVQSWFLQYSGGDMTTPQEVQVSQPEYTITGLTPSTLYSVRLASLCASGIRSEWGEAVQVSTLAAPDTTGTDTTDIGIASVALDAAFSLRPNPASVSVSLVLPADVVATVQLVDLNGRVVLASVVSDRSGRELDLRGVPTGAYFVRVVTPSAVVVRKLVVR